MFRATVATAQAAGFRFVTPLITNLFENVCKGGALNFKNPIVQAQEADWMNLLPPRLVDQSLEASY